MKKLRNMIIHRDHALKLITALSEKLHDDKGEYIILPVNEEITFLLFNSFEEIENE